MKTFRHGPLLAAILMLSACAPIRTTPKPSPTPVPVQIPQPKDMRASVWRDGDQVTPDGASLLLDDASTLQATVEGGRLHFVLPAVVQFGWHGRVTVRVGDEHQDIDVTLAADLDLTIHPLDPPILAKADFLQNFQGNFGTIKVPGCGLDQDSLFDPFLLIMWQENPDCFERMMAEHAKRDDNRIVVDPRSGYHGHNDVDLWHDPATFARFLRDVRRHTNSRGENFRILLFTAGDSHIASFMHADTSPDAAAEAHWRQDIDALAAQALPYVDLTVICWECRHQNNYMTAGTFTRMWQYLAQKFPQAVHGVHLISGSSSWSSWRCDPDNVFGGTAARNLPPSDPNFCDPSNAQLDDPNRGNEPAAWDNMLKLQGAWADVLLFQFDVGNAYLNPDSEPNYTGQPGALGRYWEVAVRLGNDPWSVASAKGNRHGWVQSNLIAFEFIYDTYWNRGGATEAYAVEFCKRALAIGGWGCGSASYRRP